MSKVLASPGVSNSNQGNIEIGDEDYTMDEYDRRIFTSVALTAARVVNLPLAASCPKGSDPIEIVDVAGGATSSNTITATKTGSDTVVGTAAINAAHGTLKLWSDGVSKWISV